MANEREAAGAAGVVVSEPASFWVRRRKLLIGLGLGLMIALIVGVNLYQNRQEARIPVRVEPVRVLELENTILAAGVVYPVKQQEFFAVGSALMVEVLVNAGDQVQEGQVLGRLDDRLFRKELREAEVLLATHQASLAEATRVRPEDQVREEALVRQAEVHFEAAGRQLERMQYLYEHGAATAVELEKAELELAGREAELAAARARLSLLLAGPSETERAVLTARIEQARAAVEVARHRLARATLRAEMDGVVFRVEAEAGQPVAVGEFLMSLVDLDHMEIRAEVGESDGRLLAVGQEVRISCAALPGRTFEGEVSEVGPGAVSQVGPHGEQQLVPVVIRVIDVGDDADGERLRPGYSVDLNIVTTAQRETLVVPYEAVIERDDVTQVFAVVGDRVELREIQVERGNELYEVVISGLEAGEEIVVEPPDHLEDGARVRATGGDATRGRQ
jgi:HlyD family secretion protein